MRCTVSTVRLNQILAVSEVWYSCMLLNKDTSYTPLKIIS